MSKINRPPVGLQKLLGSQNFGQNPTELAQTVQPTVDLTPFYGEGLLRSDFTSGSRNSEGKITGIARDKRIVLLGASAYCEVGALNTVALGITLELIPGDNPDDPIYLFRQERESMAVGNIVAVGGLLPQPLVLGPYAEVGFYWTANNNSRIDTVYMHTLYYDIDSD